MSYLVDGGSHIDKILTNLAIKGFQGRQGFIADELFPAVPVEKQSDKYFVVDPDTWLRTPDDLRAPGTPANLIEFKLSSESYFADNRALGTEYPLEILGNSDLSASRLRMMKMNHVLDAMARAREKRVASIITSISNVGSGVALSGTNQWSDYVGSNPIGDINSGYSWMELNTGLQPNTLALDRDTHRVLRYHPVLRDYFKYTGAGPLGDEQLRDVFNVDRILVARGIENGAKEGATASMTNIWGKFASLLHIGAASGMETMTFGLAFRWTPEEFPTPMVVQRYPHHNRSAMKEHQEACYFQDEKVVARNLAYTLTGTAE